MFPLFGRLALHGSGNEYDIWRYLVPATLGGLSGFLIGLQSDRISGYLTALNRELIARKKSEATLSEMFDKSQAPMLVVNPETADILEANPASAQFYGFSIDRITRMKLSEIDTLPTRKFMPKLKSMNGEGRTHKFQFTHKLASGELNDVALYPGPFNYEGEQCLLVIIHDITELNMLKTVTPICSSCNKIRTDQEYWDMLEHYIEQHPGMGLNHGICKNCTSNKAIL